MRDQEEVFADEISDCETKFHYLCFRDNEESDAPIDLSADEYDTFRKKKENSDSTLDEDDRHIWSEIDKPRNLEPYLVHLCVNSHQLIQKV